jgi:SAM-dependent methyltransferase
MADWDGFITVPDASDTRSAEEIRRHYLLEKKLAARLRDSTQEERRTLYSSLYDELSHSIVLHPHFTDPDTGDVDVELRQLERYLDPETVFLEIGAGNCSLSRVVAERVRHVWALEVSAAIAAGVPPRENLDVILSDGIDIPIAPQSATFAYSNQLLEHLHPDDVDHHFRCVLAALAPKGRYMCLTPNRLMGPADVSRYFDEEPTGFHLREYTTTEVAALMKNAGFSTVAAWTTRKGRSLRLPWWLVGGVEKLLERMSAPARRRLGATLPLRVILGAYAVGQRG